MKRTGGAIPEQDKNLHKGLAYWKKYLKLRIKQNKNFLGAFIGETGSGKSYSVLSLIEVLTEKKVDFANVFMTATDFINRLEELVDKPRDKKQLIILLWDETGKDLNAKQWQNKLNQTINIILQVFRSENIIVFFTTPYFSFLDSDARKLMHGLFEVEGIDYQTKETIIKPFMIQTNQRSGKSYPKYLRVDDDEQGLIPIERIRIPMPNPDTIAEYEKRKKVFVKNIIKEAKEKVIKMEKEAKGMRPLTNNEQEVWDLHKEGKSNEEIASICQISERMVRKYLQISKKKLGIEQNKQ